MKQFIYISVVLTCFASEASELRTEASDLRTEADELQSESDRIRVNQIASLDFRGCGLVCVALFPWCSPANASC
jgi:hypothetical protein